MLVFLGMVYSCAPLGGCYLAWLLVGGCCFDLSLAILLGLFACFGFAFL